MLPQRKQLRLKKYDYNQKGVYFITVCTLDKRHILSKIMPTPLGEETAVELTDIGNVVEQEINAISNRFPDVCVEKYVIMPNHVHLLLCIGCADASEIPVGAGLASARQDLSRLMRQETSPCPTLQGESTRSPVGAGLASARQDFSKPERQETSPCPTVGDVICAWKSLVYQKVKQPIWQKSYHDHVIRNDTDYLEHWNYINNNPAQWVEDEYYEDIPMKTVTLYTDGACSGNPGPGGWAAILMFGPHKKELSGGERDTTNNRMELTAVIEGLKALKEPCVVELYSDSKYVIDALEQGWAEGWKRRGWIKGDKKPALNPDLWEILLELSHIHTLNLHWVKGHASNPFNNRCDELAVQEWQKLK